MSGHVRRRRGAGADEEQEAERRAGADHGQVNRARQSIGLDRRPIVSPHACWIAEAESGVGDAVEHRCGDAGAGTVDEGIASSIEPAIDEPIFDLLDRRTVGMAIEIVPARSEEHTSELQSLMRISYAVFCLKKKK